jgi:hypothetical protein
MMNLKNPFGYAGPRSAEQDKPQRPPTQCMAHGCPMPGVYRTSNDASLCCVHDGEDPHAWPAQTERINAHVRLANLMLAMSNAMSGEPVKPATVEAVTSAGGPDNHDALTQRAYAQRIRAWFVKECKGERVAPVQLTPIKSLVAKLTSAP